MYNIQFISEMDNLIDIEKGRELLIACTGRNTGIYIDKIRKLIKERNLVVIGMNTINKLIVPDYHLFTNNDRILNYINDVDKKSFLLIGSHIKRHLLPKKDFALIKYTDRNPDEPMGYENGTIKGYYRVSGCLAIMIAHLMGAKKIYVTGKDGFSFNAKNYDGFVHFHPDDRSNKNNNKTISEWWERYDVPINKALHMLKLYGIDFSIITPTIFTKHYEGGIL